MHYFQVSATSLSDYLTTGNNKLYTREAKWPGDEARKGEGLAKRYNTHSRPQVMVDQGLGMRQLAYSKEDVSGHVGDEWRLFQQVGYKPGEGQSRPQSLRRWLDQELMSGEAPGLAAHKLLVRPPLHQVV